MQYNLLKKRTKIGAFFYGKYIYRNHLQMRCIFVIIMSVLVWLSW